MCTNSTDGSMMTTVSEIAVVSLCRDWHGEKLEMVLEVFGKERAKASITYTKLKLYFSHA